MESVSAERVNITERACGLLCLPQRTSRGTLDLAPIVRNPLLDTDLKLSWGRLLGIDPSKDNRNQREDQQQ